MENEDVNSNESFEVFDDEILNPTFFIGNDVTMDRRSELNLAVSLDLFSDQNLKEDNEIIISSTLDTPTNKKN